MPIHYESIAFEDPLYTYISIYTYICVFAYMCMHISVAHMTESYHMCDRVKSNISVAALHIAHIFVFVADMTESCHMCERVMSHTSVAALYMALVCLGCGCSSFSRYVCCDYSCVWHDSFICVPWLIHICVMTHSYACHDPFVCATWRIHMCDMTHHTCVMTLSYVAWLIHVCMPRLICMLVVGDVSIWDMS